MVLSQTAHGMMIKYGKNQRHTPGGSLLWLDLTSLLQMTEKGIQKHLVHGESVGIWGIMAGSMIV